MAWTQNRALGWAAISGGVAVAAGAFAAHGVVDPVARDWLKTGASYQLTHALAVFACAAAIRPGTRPAIWAPALFLIGATVFSGTLYAMAFGAARWLGAITPVGGLSLIAGWVVLAWGTFRSPDNPL